MVNLMGVPIYVDENLPKTKWAQVRFPRSKRKRIQKKWRKNPHNWDNVDCSMQVYIIDKRLFARPEVMKILANIGTSPLIGKING